MIEDEKGVDQKPHDYFRTFEACNWTEDYSHENGNYINKCISCGFNFMGHKRRVICKMCDSAEPDWAKLSDKKAPDNLGGAYAGCWLDGEMVGFSRCMVKKVKPLREELASLRKAMEATEGKFKLQNTQYQNLIDKHTDTLRALEAADKVITIWTEHSRDNYKYEENRVCDLDEALDNYNKLKEKI